MADGEEDVVVGEGEEDVVGDVFELI